MSAFAVDMLVLDAVNKMYIDVVLALDTVNRKYIDVVLVDMVDMQYVEVMHTVNKVEDTVYTMLMDTLNEVEDIDVVLMDMLNEVYDIDVMLKGLKYIVKVKTFMRICV